MQSSSDASSIVTNLLETTHDLVHLACHATSHPMALKGVCKTKHIDAIIALDDYTTTGGSVAFTNEISFSHLASFLMLRSEIRKCTLR